jgi:predicted nucleic acid-binding protein
MPDSFFPDPAFFDTNILLYLFDRNSQEKCRIAEELFNKHQQDGSLRLSLQVVHEFASNLLRRKFGIPLEIVADTVSDLLSLGVTALRAEDTSAALQYISEFGVNFWDALILAVAKREGCSVLYSEDFQHGRVYDTVRVVNPFKQNL